VVESLDIVTKESENGSSADREAQGEGEGEGGWLVACTSHLKEGIPTVCQEHADAGGGGAGERHLCCLAPARVLAPAREGMRGGGKSGSRGGGSAWCWPPGARPARTRTWGEAGRLSLAHQLVLRYRISVKETLTAVVDAHPATMVKRRRVKPDFSSLDGAQEGDRGGGGWGEYGDEEGEGEEEEEEGEDYEGDVDAEEEEEEEEEWEEDEEEEDDYEEAGHGRRKRGRRKRGRGRARAAEAQEARFLVVNAGRPCFGSELDCRYEP